MKVNINYDQPAPKEGQEVMSNQELTEDYITYAVKQKYPQGLEGQKRRIFGRIQRKLRAAKEQNLDDVELEQAEKDFLIDAFKDVKFAPALSQFVVLLEDEIDSLREKTNA